MVNTDGQLWPALVAVVAAIYVACLLLTWNVVSMMEPNLKFIWFEIEIEIGKWSWCLLYWAVQC